MHLLFQYKETMDIYLRKADEIVAERKRNATLAKKMMNVSTPVINTSKGNAEHK